MQIELKEMHKKIGITFIYVTHDQEEALTMSDTIVVMNNGAIQQVGNPIDIYNEPNNAFVANFIGESNIYNATMVGKLKVRFLNHVFDCVDDFPLNEKVDVVIRPEDVDLKKASKEEIENFKNKKKDGPLIGYISSRLFKGIHYQYVINIGKNELIVQDTKEFKTDEYIKIEIDPELIHIMKKDLTSNIFYDAWIDKQNRLVISDMTFSCDVRQLLPGSSIDEEGYLIDSKTGKKYDLKDADVIAEIGRIHGNVADFGRSHGGCCDKFVQPPVDSFPEPRFLFLPLGLFNVRKIEKIGGIRFHGRTYLGRKQDNKCHYMHCNSNIKAGPVFRMQFRKKFIF